MISSEDWHRDVDLTQCILAVGQILAVLRSHVVLVSKLYARMSLFLVCVHCMLEAIYACFKQVQALYNH